MKFINFLIKLFMSFLIILFALVCVGIASVNAVYHVSTQEDQLVEVEIKGRTFTGVCLIPQSLQVRSVPTGLGLRMMACNGQWVHWVLPSNSSTNDTKTSRKIEAGGISAQGKVVF
jgi:hypothetical protein